MNEKINLAFIGTYPEVSKIFIDIASKMENVNAISIDASFEKAAAQAKSIQSNCDVILSRGGTAEYIKNTVDIPVLTIPITPFDIVRVLPNVPEGTKEIAFIHFKKNVLSLDEIERIYNLKIHDYTFTDYGDIAKSVDDAWKKGISVVIGGTVAVQISKSYGMKGIVVSAGHEAVARAIKEALHVLQEKRKEQYKALQLSEAFSVLSEGIIIIDEKKQIVVYNPAARKIFQKQYNPGDLVETDIFNENCQKIYEDSKNAEEISGLVKMRNGLFTYSHSPVKLNGQFIGLVSCYEDVTKVQRLEQQIRKEIHAKGFLAKHTFENILGISPQLQETINMAKLYAKVDSSVLIEGESGTGKELFAQSIHNESSRKNGPFVALNCTSIPENLLESELFGYESGAFTGAKKEGKTGLFEMAHNGTLFLDEIGEIKEDMQARLLRVLQEREIMRVGGSKIIPINVRIISATNRDLWRRVKEGAFRSDLYYRLNVLHLNIPPLRSRKGDVAALCKEFADRKHTRIQPSFYADILPRLEKYSWPGNIRELESVMERYSLLSTIWNQNEISETQFHALLSVTSEDSKETLDATLPFPNGKDLKEMIENLETELINHVMKECGNNQAEAARRLGIGRTTLWRKMNHVTGESGIEKNLL